MNLIQKKCSVPFTAVEVRQDMEMMRRNGVDCRHWSHILLLLSLSLQFHYEKMQAQFFVENANIACALKNVNGKIFNEVNEKVCVKGVIRPD